MKYFSPLIQDARKKLGDQIYGRNRAGLYVRAYKIPANPQTPLQQDYREQFGSICKLWITLTQQQREGWNSLSLSAWVTDSLGHRSNPSGLSLFQSCNLNLCFTGNAYLLEPPAVVRKPRPTAVTSSTLTVAAGTLTHFSVGYAATDPNFVAQTIISATLPQKPTINFVGKALFRRVYGAITENSTGCDLTTAYAAQFGVPAIGQRVFVKFVRVDPATGFASPQYRIMATATA